MSRNRRRTAGFTLMEVAVAAVLMAVLASATLPTLSEFIHGRDATATAATLSQIGIGIASFKTSVNNSYPGFVSELTTPITTANFNSCHNTFSVGNVNSWSTSGPFVTFNIPPGGLFTPLGTIQDAMIRNPNSATVGTLAIQMTVDSVDAVRLDRIIDGADGYGVGTLRATFNGTGGQTRTADIQYLVPVTNKC